MTPSPREDHLAVKPPQDGKVVLKTSDGEEHVHIFADDNNWAQEPYGVVYKQNEPVLGVADRVVFPWTNIVHYEIYANSVEYNQRMLGWLKDCDHEWLTHPAVGHYCKHCRLDMRNMVQLYEDKLTEAPALVITDAYVDREAAEYEGVPGMDPLSNQAPTVPTVHLSVVTVDEDPDEFCKCEDDSTPHEGQCRVRPETWPLRRIDPNEEGNTEF